MRFFRGLTRGRGTLLSGFGIFGFSMWSQTLLRGREREAKGPNRTMFRSAWMGVEEGREGVGYGGGGSPDEDGLESAA
jgi:hypothetical protein